MNSKKELSRIDSSAFVFDLRSILSDAPSAFSAPKISAMTLNRLDYLSKLTDGAVAIVSDKEISKIREILQPISEKLVLIGSHGGELQPRYATCTSSEPSKKIEAVRDKVKQFVNELKPAYLENKCLGIAVHFGAAPELSGTIYKKLSKVAKSLGNEIQLIEGHYCWEIKEAKHNKGKALAQLLNTAEFSGKTPYFFGSDQSAEPAFLTVRLLDGCAVRIGKTKRNTRAEYHLENSAVLEDWIKRLCITQAVPSLSTEAGQSKPIAA